MVVNINYKIELKTVRDGLSMWPVFEVWFTDDRCDKWYVSKSVHLDRAVELLRFVQDMYIAQKDGVLLPDEFHIVGRHEQKSKSGRSK